MAGSGGASGSAATAGGGGTGGASGSGGMANANLSMDMRGARPYNDPYVLHNGTLFFVVYAGQSPSQRDMVFSWSMSGGFQGLAVGTGITTIAGYGFGQTSTMISPGSITWIPATGELLVADAQQQGLVLIDTGAVAVSRTFE